jgi:hemerythrin
MLTAQTYATTNADDHQYIEVIGDSVSAMVSGRLSDRAQLIKALHTLKRSLQLHFLIEENTMSDLGYDGLPEHHRSHLLIVSEVNGYLQSIAGNNEEPSINIWPQVKTILRHHMQRFDTDFAHYLERRAALAPFGQPTVMLPPFSGILT